MRECGFLMAVLALAACHSAPQAEQADAGTAGAEAEAAASNAGLPAQAPNTIRGTIAEAGDQAGAGMTPSVRDCHFEVDGKRLVDGPCRVFPMGKDQYTLNTWDGGKPRQSHFAVVTTQSDGRTTATWNKDADDSRAYDPLGVVTKRNGCWVNVRTRICAQ